MNCHEVRYLQKWVLNPLKTARSLRQNDPYMSIYPKDTVKEALEDALRGFLMWYTPEDVEETRFEHVDDW